jgi:hypothetical protein
VQNGMHDWVESLLHFRDSQPAFSDGTQPDILYDATTGSICERAVRIMVAVQVIQTGSSSR